MFTLKISERKGLGKLVMYFSIEEDLSLLSANQSKLKWHYFFSYIWCFNDYNGENLLNTNFPPTCPSCQFVTFFLVPLHSDKSDQCLINLTYQWMYRGPSTLTGIDRTEEETNSPVIHQSCTIQFTGIQYSNWSIFQFVCATRSSKTVYYLTHTKFLWISQREKKHFVRKNTSGHYSTTWIPKRW